MIADFMGLRPAGRQAFHWIPSVNSPVPGWSRVEPQDPEVMSAVAQVHAEQQQPEFKALRELEEKVKECD